MYRQKYQIMFGFFLVVIFSLVRGGYAQIDNHQATNLTSSSTTITWLSIDSVDACVYYGLTTALGDSLNDATIDDIHSIQILNLSPNTTYYYEIRSGSFIDNNGGSYYTFTTAEVGAGIPYALYGTTYCPDTTAAYGSLVIMVVKNGAATSHPLSSLVDINGLWYFSLGDLKDNITNDVFGYATGDTVFVTVYGAGDGYVVDTIIISGSSPQDCDTTFLQKIPTPEQLSPDNDIEILCDQPTEFAWSSVMDVTKYEIQFDNDIPINTSLDTTYELISCDLGQHIWRIRAGNDITWGSMSQTRTYTIHLEIPTLITPSDGDTIMCSQPTPFTWNDIHGATQYEIQFDEDTPINIGTDTTYELISCDEGLHTWKMRAGRDTTWENWSETRSFYIWQCDCEPGNANADEPINIFDITYLISYLYLSGPAPTPYELCNGDPNNDCTCNIFDITYLISFLYLSGPPPCTCVEWLAACGLLLRK